jgi:hypothetical protein
MLVFLSRFALDGIGDHLGRPVDGGEGRRLTRGLGGCAASAARHKRAGAPSRLRIQNDGERELARVFA